MPRLFELLTTFDRTPPLLGRSTRLTASLVLLLVSGVTVAHSAETGPQFKSILEKRSRETFQIIVDYVTQSPEARDLNQASAWLLENAVRLHLEGEAVPVTELLLKRSTTPQPLRHLAQQVKGLG